MIFIENEDLETVFSNALNESKQTGKKILVEYGGDWCIWSQRMAGVLNKPKMKSFIEKNFIFIRCFVGRDSESNSALIEFPDLESVPYFSLVDSNGKILENQATESFEILWFYKKSKILKFLKTWAKL